MPGKLKYQHTYLPYTDGIDPRLLRVGTLVLDLYNPTEGKETDRFEFCEDLSQEEYEAKIKALPGYSERIQAERSLNFSASKEWGISAGIIDLAHGGANSQAEIHASIEGGRFRRIEMQKPVKFLEEVVLKQPGIDTWIRKKTTAEWYTRLYNKMDGSVDSVKTPKIWVCTGVQLISAAKVKSGASTRSGQDGGVKLDAGVLAGGPPTGVTAAELEAHRSRENAVDSEYTSDDERVWCAKFFSLRIKLTHPDETGAAAEKRAHSHDKVLRVLLDEVEDLGAGGVREDVSEIVSPVDEDSGKREAAVEGLDLPAGGRFTAQSEEDNDIVVSDKSYAEAVEGIKWEVFNEYNSYVDSLD